MEVGAEAVGIWEPTSDYICMGRPHGLLADGQVAAIFPARAAGWLVEVQGSAAFRKEIFPPAVEGKPR